MSALVSRRPRHRRPVRTVGSWPAVIRSREVAGIPCAVTSLPEAVEWLAQWIREGRGGIGVRLVNAYSIVSAHQRADYLELMQTRGVSLPDGAPIAIALRLLARERTASRVRGPSFFVAALRRGTTESGRHFFLGTTSDTLDQLESAIAREMPDLPVAGFYAPPFGAPDDRFIAECAAQVREAGADCVWVALGTPKQDLVADRLAEALDIPCVAVGAAFDFLAGTKREAPRIVQTLGVEWVYRLATEPRRLWRRYLVGNLQFVTLIARRHLAVDLRR